MKIHEDHFGNKVVAASDSDIIGKDITDSDRGIEIRVSKDFYGETEFELGDIIKYILEVGNANVMGTGIVDALTEENVVDPVHVVMIGDVKHAQIYRIYS